MPGLEYFIAIDGANGSTGSIVLNYRRYARLYRLYLQNFNGFPTSIVPSPTPSAIREDGQGQPIIGTLVSLGVYEFDLPDDHLPYVVTISGPAGIIWQPSTYRIEGSAGERDKLTSAGTCPSPTPGGPNQTSNPTNAVAQHFYGYIDGTLQQFNTLGVQIASTGGDNARPPEQCGPPTIGTSPPVLVSANRVQYDCLAQPNTDHQIVPNTLNRAFDFRVLPLPSTRISTTHLARTDEAITATPLDTFSISGQVRNGSTPLSCAAIDISKGIFTMRVRSDLNGNYIAPNLTPGVYTLRVVLNGFIFPPEMVTIKSGNVARDLSALPCSYTFKGDGNFDGFGGQDEFAVTQINSSIKAVIGAQCTWVAERGSDWVSVLSSSNLGDGTVQYSVQPNPLPTSRQATISIGGDVFTITQTRGFPVTGTIRYGNAPSGTPTPGFVSNVLLSGAGSFAVSTTSAFPDGTYSLAGFRSGAYTVTPSKTGGVGGAITSFDAGRIALHVAGPPLPQLSGNQRIVADVSGNGFISSLDAGMIAKFVAGPPYIQPGIGQTGRWRFSPVSRTYSTVNAIISGQDYSALLMGEVSGNWVNTAVRPANRGPERGIDRNYAQSHHFRRQRDRHSGRNTGRRAQRDNFL